MQFIIATLVINNVTCISSFIIPNVLWQAHKSDINTNTHFADSLSLSNRMSAFRSPFQEAEVIISRYFINVSGVRYCSCFLVKAYSLQVTTGEISFKKAAVLPGTAPPGSVMAFCTQQEKTLDPTGHSLGGTRVDAALLVHSPPKNACLKCLFSFHSQPLGLVGITPTVPYLLLPHLCLRCLLCNLPSPASCR